MTATTEPRTATPAKAGFVVEPPGVRWTYNGGTTALLARLIARGTGRPVQDFARAALFEPLGIAHSEWGKDRAGEAYAASGLRMTPRDLARIGMMALDGGRWGGRQVVPADWLAAAFAPAVALPDGRRFGYHWYMRRVPVDDGADGMGLEDYVGAFGNGGQRLFLVPRLDLVVAITAGNYETAEQWVPPLVVLRDVLLPALQRV